MSTDQDRTLARMADAIAYLTEHWDAPPDLSAAARACGMSPWHFQRQFTRAVGVSPKRFTGFLALGHAREALKRDAPVLDAALGAGLSGPSRLHDLAIAFEAATPGEIKSGGAGLEVRFGTADTPFGPIFAAASGRGITRLAFIDGDRDGAAALASERETWPRAGFVKDPDIAPDIAAALFKRQTAGAAPLRLAPRGTNFQVKVWQALLAIPPGSVATYTAIARAIGTPRAARAVGGACAANPIALLIPCHRVLRQHGALGGYAFGLSRKRALIAWEAAVEGMERAGPAPGGRKGSAALGLRR